jgi:putative hemolysin
LKSVVDLALKAIVSAVARFPKVPLPLARLNGGLDVEAPPLIKGYLKLGAKICSAPEWDPDFNSAVLLTLLRLSEINPRYAKHFLGK